MLSVVAPTPNLDRRSGGNPDWTGRDSARATATRCSPPWRRAAGPASPARSRSRSWRRPLDWAAPGMAAGTPFALAHTFGQTGPFRPSTLPRRGPRTSSSPARGAARRRRADGADQRPAGRRADHRDDRDRRGRPGERARRRLRALRRDRRRARQELPPGHPAAHRRPPSGRARPLRRRPHRRRPGRPARRRPGRRPRRAGRAAVLADLDAGLVRRPGPAGAGATPTAATTSRSSTSSTSSPP